MYRSDNYRIFPHKGKVKLIYIFIFIFGTYLGCDSSIGPGAHTFNPGPILFHSSKDGVNNLYSMNDDGTNVKQLTRFDLSASRAIWSPDGERIAFTRSLTKDDFDFVHGIFIMNADGTGLKQVTFPPTGYFRNAGDGIALHIMKQRQQIGVQLVQKENSL